MALLGSRVRSPVGDAPMLKLGGLLDIGLAAEHGIDWHQSRVEDDTLISAGKVVIAWPSEGREPVDIQPQQAAILAQGAADALYTCDATVERLIDEQPPCLALSFDSPWRRIQRRQDVRLPLVIKPTLAERLTQDGWWPVNVIIRNLSAGGILLRSEQQLQLGERLDLGFSLPNRGAELRVRLETRRIEPFIRNGLELWDIGCRFHESSNLDREQIVKFIFAQQRALARRDRGF